MSNQFQWHTDEEFDPPPDPSPPRRSWEHIGFWLATAVIITILAGSWIIGKRRLAQADKNIRADLQALVDLQQDAFLAGDGDLFFTFLSSDPGWQAAQLLPFNQAAQRAGFAITRIESNQGMIWANATCTEGNETYQRLLFFENRNGRYRQTATDPDYWGKLEHRETEWGDIHYYEADDEWVIDIIASVANICGQECKPFTLVVTDNYAKTAMSGAIHIPSPRLIGLDENGRPSHLFWQQLRQQIEAYQTPAVIRFAVPPSRVQNQQGLFNYERAAAQFMADHPNITIEIISLEALPENPAQLAAEFDGAAIPPTRDMLAAGQVVDLTDYINSDLDFDQADFYEQIWQGARWHDRLWMMPLAAQMPVLYYDKAAYQQAGMTEPSLRWTWAEMERDMATVVAAQPEASDLAWGFLDAGLDSLFSYAYNWENNCSQTVSIFCQRPLRSENVAAALDWYTQRAGQPEQMPDLTTNPEKLLGLSSNAALSTLIGDKRQFILWNFQTSRRKVAIWVDLPVNYEYQFLLVPLGVVPFPGSDRFDGITPLWVQGAFISQQSERPYAVWQWLKFLSYQSPTPRMIPARPSVARETGYWRFMSRPVGNAMRAAFPFARPVTIEDKTRLTWDQVTAVASGELTPAEAARQRPNNTWFGNPTTTP